MSITLWANKAIERLNAELIRVKQDLISYDLSPEARQSAWDYIENINEELKYYYSMGE